MEQTQQMQKIEGPSPMGPQVEKEKHKYIFPNIMAKMMKNVSMQVQFESSLMACALILVGLILMAGFMFFFGDQSLSYKIILAINLIGGFIFMSSSLVTTYQQYQSYMDIMDFQTTMGMTSPQQKPIKKYNRKNQFLFFGGLIIGISSLFVPGLLINQFSNLLPYEYYILGLMALIGILMIIAAVKKPKQKPVMMQPKQIMKSPVTPAIVQRQIMKTSVQPQQVAQRPVQRIAATALPVSKPAIQPQQVIQRPVQQQGRSTQEMTRIVQSRPVVQQMVRPTIQRDGLQNKPTALPVLKPAIRPQVQQQPRPIQQPVRQPIPARIVQRPAPQPVQRQQIPAQRPIPTARPVIQAQQRPIQQQTQPRVVLTPQVQQQPIPTPVLVRQEPRIEKPGLFSRLKARFNKPKVINPNQVPGSKPISKKEQEMMNKIEQSLNKQLYDVDYMKAKERRL